MITVENYERILDEGLILDHYFLLCTIHEGGAVPKSKRIDGFINLLTKKEYLLEGTLTDKALDLICTSVPSTSTTTTNVGVVDFTKWVIELYGKCQQKLQQLTGLKQVRPRVKGSQKTYPFMPNATDFGKVLARAINAYKLKDMGAIETAVLGHIQKCKETVHWFPLMKYYIMKDGQSDMVTDMENPDENIVKPSQQKHV